MKQSVRTFVAVEVGPEVRAAAAELIGELSGAAAGVKWVDPENMHLTLKFLGDVDLRESAEVCRSVQEAVADAPPFRFEVSGAGAFPKLERPRTIWLGVEEGAEHLGDLHKRVEKALKKIGYPAEGRSFKPHLTLGRVRKPGPDLAALTALLRERTAWKAGSTRVERVTVFSSDLTPEGPVYGVLAQAPLAK